MLQGWAIDGRILFRSRGAGLFSTLQLVYRAFRKLGAAMKVHVRYLLASSLTALLTPGIVHAQVGDAERGTAADTSDIIVTGTRVTGRQRLDTASPVDVPSGAALRSQGTTELGRHFRTSRRRSTSRARQRWTEPIQSGLPRYGASRPIRRWC